MIARSATKQSRTVERRVSGVVWCEAHRGVHDEEPPPYSPDCGYPDWRAIYVKATPDESGF